MTPTKRVLVLDDEPQIRRVVATVLRRRADLKVLEAAENRDALHVLARGPVDAIVMDFNRPNGTALDLMHAITALVHHRNIGVMVLSADSPALHTHEDLLRQLGVRHLALKPFDPVVLLDAVGALLNAPVDGRLVLLLHGTEDANTDYKARIDLSDRVGVARLAKDVIAMANTPGGVVTSSSEFTRSKAASTTVVSRRKSFRCSIPAA